MIIEFVTVLFIHALPLTAVIKCVGGLFCCLLLLTVNRKHKAAPEEKELPDLYLQRNQATVTLKYKFLEYSNLFSHILILCITTNVDEKEKHIRINVKSSAAFKKKRCSLLRCIWRGSRGRLPWGESLRGHHWSRSQVNEQEILVLSEDRQVTQTYNRFGKS